MTALTHDRDTPRREGDEFAFEAATTIYAGSMVCLNADGKAAPASIASGLGPVVGRAERRANAGEKAPVRRGVFAFDALADDAPTLAEVGSLCYAADDCTVRKTAAPNAPAAGVVYDVDDDGVWVKI